MHEIIDENNDDEGLLFDLIEGEGDKTKFHQNQLIKD